MPAAPGIDFPLILALLMLAMPHRIPASQSLAHSQSHPRNLQSTEPDLAWPLPAPERTFMDDIRSEHPIAGDAISPIT